jgi:tetratricopeptide (TPR) repeat protein
MPVNVVLDYPTRHTLRPLLRRLIGTLAGGALVVAGIVATLGLLPAGFLVLAALGDASQGDLPGSDAEIFTVAAGLLAIAVGGWRVGLRLLRGERELVLFLRRFGYHDATQVATFAATRTIGRSWRLVTLDDAAVAPVGVASGLAGAARVAGVVRTGGPKVFELLKRIFIIGWWASAAIVGYAYFQDGTLEPEIDSFTTLLSGHLPLDAIEPTVSGAVAVAGIFFALFFVAVCVLALAGVAALVLSPILFAGGSVLNAVSAAEQAKVRRVDDLAAIEQVVDALDAGSRKVLAPRLVVLHVASELWQQTVSRLASVGSLTIIDVSEPTENLLWEIQELTDRLGPRCVFVAHHERIGALIADPPPAGSLQERLLGFLDGRDVLAYGTDRDAVRRFARALRDNLVDLATRFDEPPAPELGTATALVDRSHTREDLGRLHEEVGACDAVVARYGDAPEPAQRARVANALVDKAFALARLGHVEEAFGVCDELIARFGDAPEPELRERVCEGLTARATALGALGRLDDQILVLGDIQTRYADAPEPALRERAGAAEIDRAFALGHLGRNAEALAVCEAVVARHRDAPDPEQRDRYAQALVSRGANLAALGRQDEALDACDDVIARYGEASDPVVRSRAAAATVNKGTILAKLGREEEARALYEDVIARYSDASEPALLHAVAQAKAARFWGSRSGARVGSVLTAIASRRRR